MRLSMTSFLINLFYFVYTKVRADEVGSRNALPFVLKRGGRLVFPDEDAAKRRRSAREALRKKERKEEALEKRKDLYGFDDGEPLTAYKHIHSVLFRSYLLSKYMF